MYITEVYIFCTDGQRHFDKKIRVLKFDTICWNVCLSSFLTAELKWNLQQNIIHNTQHCRHIHGYHAQKIFDMKCQIFFITVNLYWNMKLFLKYVLLIICENVIQDFSSVSVNASVTGPKTEVFPVLTVCDVHELCTTVNGEPVTTRLPSDLTLIEVQYVWTKIVLTKYNLCRW